MKWDSELSIRILAIVLALFTWAYVKVTHGDATRIISSIPISKVEVAPGMNAALHEYTLEIMVKGPSDLVNNIIRETVIATVDASNITQTETRQLPVNVKLPTGVELAQKITVSVTVTPLKKIKMPVTVSFIAAPNPGASIGVFNIEPAEVEVAGSEEALAKMKYVTVRLDPNVPLVAKRALNLYALTQEGERVDGVTVQTPTALVSMASLTGDKNTRQVAVRVPELKNTPSTYLVIVKSMTPDQVTVSGDPATLDRLEGYISTESIDVRTVTQDVSRTVRLQVPQGVTVVGDSEIRVNLQANAKRF
ncbi:MAG: CdaR family protein [bacterium]